MTFHPLRITPCCECNTPVETRSPYLVCCEPCREVRAVRSRGVMSYAYGLPVEAREWLRRPVCVSCEED